MKSRPIRRRRRIGGREREREIGLCSSLRLGGETPAPARAESAVSDSEPNCLGGGSASRRGCFIWRVIGMTGEDARINVGGIAGDGFFY